MWCNTFTGRVEMIKILNKFATFFRKWCFMLSGRWNWHSPFAGSGDAIPLPQHCVEQYRQTKGNNRWWRDITQSEWTCANYGWSSCWYKTFAFHPKKQEVDPWNSRWYNPFTMQKSVPVLLLYRSLILIMAHFYRMQWTSWLIFPKMFVAGLGSSSSNAI